MTATFAPQPPAPAIDPRPRLDVDPPANTKELPNIFNRAVALKVDMGMLGSKKKLSASQIEVDADKDRVTASKAILASPELEAIAQAQRGVGAAMRKFCLPSFFKSGIYLIPIASISDIDKLLVEAQAKLTTDLIPKFLEAYPTLVEQDKLSLRTTFNPTDYPALVAVKNAFYMEWSYISFGVPDELEKVDSSIFVREQEKQAAKLAQAAEQIQQVLRAQMLDLVSHLSERLSGARDGGKPKIFRDSVVTNVKEFLQTFQARNITDDAELDALCARAKGLLDGVDPDALRESDVTRDKVRIGFEQIKTQLDEMLVAKPSRMIQFADAAPEPPAAPEAQAAMFNEINDDDSVPF